MTKTILALGEVLWDVFPDGPRFGGAPANFAWACAGLSEDRVFLASAVGDDDLGHAARERLGVMGVDLSHLVTTTLPTGQVLVSLDANGQGSYRFIENPAWDEVPLSASLLQLAREADAIYFGTLGQRAEFSRTTIRTILRAAKPESLRVLDLNLRPPHWTPEIVRESLSLANVLKLNDDEFPILADILGLSGPVEAQLDQLQKSASLELIALTRGARGSLMLRENGERVEHSGTPTDVIDTVGAGDAFTAVLTLGLLHQQPLEAISHVANQVAAYVCTQPGGTQTFPPGLKSGSGFTKPGVSEYVS
ncbi:MAG: carbohydrate kinase family protein [Fimbriiglobus sp.]